MPLVIGHPFLDHPGQHAIEDRQENFFLRPEVIRELAPRHSGPLLDFGQGEPVQPLGGDNLRGRLDNFVPAFPSDESVGKWFDRRAGLLTGAVIHGPV
jgi:hypothetical protein